MRGEGKHVMRLPADELVARVTRAIGLATAAAGGVAFLLAPLLVRTITRPLAQVAAAAEQVTAGDLATHAPLAGPREVRQVAGAFNQMTETLAWQEDLRRALQAVATRCITQ